MILIAKPAEFSKRLRFEFLLSRDHKIKGGNKDTELNEFTVKPGDTVKKGDQIGMFHYGGSSHLLIFKPDVKLEFDLRGQTPGLETKNILVNSKLATVVD